ncbi:MAG: ferrous iron transport protein B [Phycisphaerales bacterium]|nr:MAG: ferrous iron transport protein B [Phycisphaerales bacterium]
MHTSAQTHVECDVSLVALVGNPNTGKTTLFNALTGYRQRVGNYPGITVDRKSGLLRGLTSGKPIEVIDLPGTYSFSARSADEAVVLDVLAGHRTETGSPDVIVVVLDSTNLARNLFFASQVFELGKPVVLVLNMIDLAEARGLNIDAGLLSRELGVPVIPIVATRQSGVDELRRVIADSLDAPAPQNFAPLPESVRVEVERLMDSIVKSETGADYAPCRTESLQALLDPGGFHETRLIRQGGSWVEGELAQRRERIRATNESLAEVEARVRYSWIGKILERTVTQRQAGHHSRSELADRFLTHRVLGLVVLAVIMGGCFQSVYVWAGPVMDAIDGTFSALGAWAGKTIPAGAFQSLLADGIIAGVGAVFVFLPQILVLFLFIAVLEDCGYMARVAFLLDRWMGLLGLSGKSFIPLLSSFACAVPGIMATRTIEDRRDRFVTILIAPLMSCSARLPVYVLLIGAFVPKRDLLGGFVSLQAVALLAVYAVGFLTAIAAALILKMTMLRGAPHPFLMELPSYKRPSARTVFYRMYEQGKVFCLSAGTIIVAVTVVVWALGYYPRPASISIAHDAQRQAARGAFEAQLPEVAATDTADNPAIQPDGAAAQSRTELEERLAQINRSESGAYLRQSILGRMGRWVEPVVKPLGWDWRIGTAVIASFPAREVVIATLGTIYNLGGEQDETAGSLRQKLHSTKWPDGRPVFNLAVAFSIMVFFALCCQCGATLAAIKRETKSWRWPIFTFTYMTSLAYLGALLTYQILVRFV